MVRNTTPSWQHIGESAPNCEIWIMRHLKEFCLIRYRVDVNAVGTVLAFPVLAVTGGNVATRKWVVKVYEALNCGVFLCLFWKKRQSDVA